MSGEGRLVVVSNRLPITIESTQAGHRPHPSGGGLVSALVPVLRKTGGCWVGWTGTDYHVALPQLLRDWCSGESYSFEPVFLTASERARYYRGFRTKSFGLCSTASPPGASSIRLIGMTTVP